MPLSLLLFLHRKAPSCWPHLECLPQQFQKNAYHNDKCVISEPLQTPSPPGFTATRVHVRFWQRAHILALEPCQNLTHTRRVLSTGSRRIPVSGGSAIRAPGWRTARDPTSGPSSTHSGADALPVAYRSFPTHVRKRHSRRCTVPRCGAVLTLGNQRPGVHERPRVRSRTPSSEDPVRSRDRPPEHVVFSCGCHNCR